MKVPKNIRIIMKHLAAAGVLELVGQVREHGRMENQYRLIPEFQRMSRDEAMEKMGEIVWERATPAERKHL